VPVMRLVELIPALQTNEDTMTRARAFAEACGKEVTVSKDVPGCRFLAVKPSNSFRFQLTLDASVSRSECVSQRPSNLPRSCSADGAIHRNRRVLIPFLNEAILTLESGTATAEDIDKTFVLGLSSPRL
jgi:3-hydroxybutyryl-CoA dehydrogenase